ncbi:hypothetical protein GmRootV512_11340 [Variovorax sp. V512]
MVQVGAKTPLRNRRGQVAVGGRDHTHVDLAHAVAAGALHLAALQHAQQLGLHAQRQFADLVEKERAAIGDLELAVAVLHGAGERAALVTEEFAVGQRLGQRRAVDLHERLLAAPRARVQALRDQVLAHAGFAEQQHREVGHGDGVDLVAQLLHRRAAAQQLAGRAAACAQRLRHGLLAHRARLHLADRVGGLDAGFDEGDQCLHLRRAHGIEGVRLQGVQREQAPDGAAQAQRRAHAVVHRQDARLAGDEAVVRVGQVAVVGETQAAFAVEQAREARMGGDGKLAPEGFIAQAVDRDGLQHVDVELQQRGGIAADQSARGGEQRSVAGGLGFGLGW